MGNISMVLVWLLLNTPGTPGTLGTPGSVPAKADDGTASPRPQQDAPSLDWSHAREVFRQVETWVRDGAVDDQKQSESVWGLVGVKVTLRWSGRQVAVGEARVPVDPAQPTAESVNLWTPVRQAALLAMQELRRTARDVRLRAVLAGVREGEDDVALYERLCRWTLVDVQLAHRVEPLRLTPGSQAEDLYRQFAPGYHGLILARRGGDASVARVWVWPASALAANQSPQSQLVSAMSELGYAPTAVIDPSSPALGDAALTALRFEVIHVARPTLNLPMTRLVRGNVPLPTISLSEREVSAAADRLALHLLRRVREDGSFTGMYHPTSDQIDPEVASPADAALAAYALGRYTRRIMRRQSDDDRRQLFFKGFVKAMAKLTSDLQPAAQLDDAPPPCTEPAAAALVILALWDGPFLAEPKTQRDALTAQLLSLRNGDGSFNAPDARRNPLLSPSETALVVAALACVHEQRRDPALAQAALASLHWLWANTPADKLATTMPWLAMAQFWLGPLDPESEVQRLTALRSIARLLHTRQVRPPALARLAGPEDVVGGFELTIAGPDVIPNPDWRTGQMAAFLALALAQPGLASREERANWLLDCGLASRFLAQLMFDEPGCYYVRGLSEVIGGVRPALWDNRLGLGPTAMALLAVTQLEQSLETVGRSLVGPRDVEETTVGVEGETPTK